MFSLDASIEFIVEMVIKYDFKAVQLHGSESADYCNQLKTELKKIPTVPTLLENMKSKNSGVPDTIEIRKSGKIQIWKVFSIKDTFDFTRLSPYEGIVNAFLFDTKGKEKGGNGYTFDWSVLNNYTSPTPIILSGGIGLDEVDQIRVITKTSLPIVAIDLNSKLEHEPGLKNIEKVKDFITNLNVRRDVL